MVAFHPGTDDGRKFVICIMLDEAALYVDDVVRALGKAANRQAVLFPFCHRDLHLVAVMPRIIGSQSGIHVDARKMTNAFQGIDDGLTLLNKLRLIG